MLFHEGGDPVKCASGSIEYKGGWTECIVVREHMSHTDFVSKLCGELNIDQNSIKLEFMVKFDPSCLQSLHDDTTILKMFRFNEMFGRVYVSPSTEVVASCIAPTKYIWPYQHHIHFV